MGLIALTYTGLNGYLQGDHLKSLDHPFTHYLQARSLGHYVNYPANWLWDPRFLVGSTLWLIGFVNNVKSDNILLNLRKPGETGYKIPRGGWFEYVSAANYFSEIVEVRSDHFLSHLSHLQVSGWVLRLLRGVGQDWLSCILR